MQKELTAHQHSVTCLDANKRHVWSGAQDGVVLRWDAADPSECDALQGHNAAVNALLVLG